MDSDEWGDWDDGDLRGDKQTLLESLLPNGRGIWVAADHGVSKWPVAGLEDMQKLVNSLTGSDGIMADAIVVHRGVIDHIEVPREWSGGWVMHLSASTVHGGEHADWKVLAGDADTLVWGAVERCAKAVSVQVNLGEPQENEMIQALGDVAEACREHDMPLLGMIYPRGPNLSPDPDDETKGVAHAARLGWELGCDVVKVPWTGSIESFRQVSSCVPIPVLVAGGPHTDDFSDVLVMVHDACRYAGAAGTCIGRNVFADGNPAERVMRLNQAMDPLSKYQDPGILDELMQSRSEGPTNVVGKLREGFMERFGEPDEQADESDD